ncbi:MAG TPA: hypothetical protein VJY33_03445, partial [Isosphaeraceae bacterium]|nr:hypothetical protein [Isosphaeraceae bacterium]
MASSSAALDKYRERPVLLTMSSFMSRGKRRAETLAAVSSLLGAHAQEEQRLLREVIVINEYDANRREDFGHAVRQVCPRVEFIQKGPNQRGQARTLNMILDRLAGYEYWIHWEESWVCTKPFIARALDVMTTTDLIQLQVTNNWLDVGSDRLRPSATAEGTRFVRVLPHSRTADLIRGVDVAGYDRLISQVGFGQGWPLYSLLPSINRAAFCREVGRFDEDGRLWPFKFE